jgi:uridine kinase
MEDIIINFANKIHHDISGTQVYIVGIDGLGGSGKSTLADRLRHRLEAFNLNVTIVHFDDFFLPSAERSQLPFNLRPIGSDFDWIHLREQVLKPLREGRSARYLRYDWPSDQLAESHEILPGGIVIIEGVYSTRAELRDFFDYRIWVDCPGNLRLNRGLARDGESIRSRWLNEWMPAEDRYFNEQQPQTFAHTIIDGAAT